MKLAIESVSRAKHPGENELNLLARSLASDTAKVDKKRFKKACFDYMVALNPSDQKTLFSMPFLGSACYELLEDLFTSIENILDAKFDADLEEFLDGAVSTPEMQKAVLNELHKRNTSLRVDDCSKLFEALLSSGV